jgi:hypothetical protein|nr:MAG TPA: replisome organizer [Caudoviricetes sp.]
MAERRMFAKAIIDSDAFLDMPLSAQALYFHLSMRADDDGFVGNPKRIRGMLGANEDDFKLLILKRFLLTFGSGVVVIKHWKIHNYIQSDRYKETTYIDEKATLTLDGKKAYTECNQLGDEMDTQDSIDKDSLDKKSIDKYNAQLHHESYPNENENDNENLCSKSNRFSNDKEKDKVSMEEIENYFKYIYELYPRKVSKVQGKNTFIKKLQGIRKDDARKKAAEIYRLLERYNEAWKRENDGEGRKLEHIPYFSTWLNSNVEDSDKQ